MKNYRKIQHRILSVVFTPIIFLSFIQTTSAQSLCVAFPFLDGLEFLGFPVCTASRADAEALATTLGNTIRFFISLIFIGIIGFAIFMIIKSAVKYIQSEGEDEKVEEAKKSIKNVFLGIGALFLGIIGLVFILTFFNTGVGNITIDPSGTSDSILENFFKSLFGIT